MYNHGKETHVSFISVLMPVARMSSMPGMQWSWVSPCERRRESAK